jgi:hypothetical protein
VRDLIPPQRGRRSGSRSEPSRDQTPDQGHRSDTSRGCGPDQRIASSPAQHRHWAHTSRPSVTLERPSFLPYITPSSNLRAECVCMGRAGQGTDKVPAGLYVAAARVPLRLATCEQPCHGRRTQWRARSPARSGDTDRPTHLKGYVRSTTPINNMWEPAYLTWGYVRNTPLRGVTHAAARIGECNNHHIGVCNHQHIGVCNHQPPPVTTNHQQLGVCKHQHIGVWGM